jgi:S1-C subfamily serine protease
MKYFRALFPILFTAFLAACSTGKTEVASALLGQASEPETAGSDAPLKRARTASGDESKCKAQEVAQTRAERLLVIITTRFASGAPSEFGAGLLLSVRGPTATILTAKHVVAKAGAGRPSIEVAIEGADGGVRKLPAEVATRFHVSSDAYSDIAILQADLSGAGPIATPDWAVLRSQQNARDLKDFVVIGNPGGAGKTVTPKGDADFRSARELRVNAGVMAPGYSGGGVFDSQRRLTGLVFEDGGQYAAAYPIDPVLGILKQTGVPVDLRIAPEGKRNVYLTDVDASTPELKQAARSAIIGALEKAGFEPECAGGSSYKLTLSLKGMTTSGISSTVEITPTFLGPDGGQFQVDKEQISFVHMIGRSSLNSVEAMEDKMRQFSGKLVEKLVTKMTGISTG